MRIDTMSPRIFVLFELSYTTRWCWVGRYWYSRLSYWDGWAKLAMYRPIHDLVPLDVRVFLVLNVFGVGFVGLLSQKN